MPGYFKDRVAVVTGAASPIGRAIAIRLANGGAKLVLADIAESGLRELANKIGAGASYVAGDLSDEHIVAQVFANAMESHGKVDILINNAGGGVIRPFLEHTPETLRQTLDRNLWTCIWACRQALPLMIARNYGRIVNLGADSVRNGLLQHAAYNAAKGGVHGLTTGLAREFAMHNITVNTVAPCIVRTPLVDEAVAAGNPLVDQFLSVVPKGRAGELDEVASMVAHLAAEESGFVTGQVISVNGGSTML